MFANTTETDELTPEQKCLESLNHTSKLANKSGKNIHK